MSGSDKKIKERPYAGMSKAARVAKRREQFLAAGLEVIGGQGYRAATVRVVCRQAGLTDRYFYESFSNNESLLMAVYIQCMEKINAELGMAWSEASANLPAEEVLLRCIDRFYALMENRQVARVVMLEVVGVSRAVDELATKHSETIAGLMMNLGQKLYVDEDCEHDRAAWLSVAMLGAFRQTTIAWMAEDYRQPRSALVDAMSTVLLGTLQQQKPSD